MTTETNNASVKIIIDDKYFDEMQRLEPENYVDICVVINGVKKEYTFGEFKKLLGFEQ